MKNFKLIAIRPLAGCNKRFIKNLTPGHIYQMYNGFIFLNKDGKLADFKDEVFYIEEKNNTPDKFFNINNDRHKKITVNVSAIAGKNGSGKSTIVEFLFAALYLFSVNHKLLNTDPEKNKEYVDKLTEEKKKLSKAEMERNTRFKSLLQKDLTLDSVGDFFQHESEASGRMKFITEEIKSLKKLSQNILIFQKNFRGEIYFLLDEQYCKLHISYDKIENNPVCKLSVISSKKNQGFDSIIEINHALEEFFYTIAVNNSHYGLNSQYLGEWINQLFHKNDGYTAPLVISPMRTDGDFQIIPEMKRAKYRLLTNVLTQWSTARGDRKKFLLTDKQYISRMRLQFNHSKVAKIPKEIKFAEGRISGNIRFVTLFKELLAHFLPQDELLFYNTEFPLKEIVCNYIVQKFEKITEVYPWFGVPFEFSSENKFIINTELITAIRDDNSHITYKLRQAFNFLHYCLNKGRKSLFHVTDLQLKKKSNVVFEPSPKQLIDWMDVPKDGNLMHFLPPAFFDIDFVLDDGKGSVSYFNDLSSGEQQKVHTIQSVVYHLNNIQSIHDGSYSDERVKYKAVNIVFDEIELYFHPDYQRKFLLDLLTAIDNLQLEKRDGIESINILFLTHSPFILSDIPRENILLLEIDKLTLKSVTVPVSPDGNDTFAANINDLLADGFFLKGTLMGAFAEQKIKNMIKKINNKEKLSQLDMRTLRLIGDDFLQVSIENLVGSSK